VNSPSALLAFEKLQFLCFVVVVVFRLTSHDVHKGPQVALNQYKINIKNNSIYTICHIAGEEIENVETFRYLGAQIKYDEPTTGDAELELRVDSAVAKFYELGMKLMNYKISLKTRVKILNSLVRSRLTYSCQCWSLTEKQKQKISSTYNGFLRRMVKGGFRRKKDTWNFALTNNEILEMASTEEIKKFIHKQQRTFVARAIRMENTNGTKRLLFNDNPSHLPGRKVTLYSNVLKAEGIHADEFIKRSMDEKY